MAREFTYIYVALILLEHRQENKVNPSTQSTRLFGLNIRAVTLRQAVALLATRIGDRQANAGVVVTPNVDHLVRLERNPEFKEGYARAEFIFADGMPVVWASRLLGNPLPGRVTGADLFVELCREAVAHQWKVAVLGGVPGSEQSLLERFQRYYPGIDVDIMCPSMQFDPLGAEGESAAQAIRDLAPHVVFVCLGMPKQEVWSLHYGPTLPGSLVLCVGAAMEFGIGLQRRAPRFVQRFGMEWFWRLASNPKRFWRRYLVDDPRFARLCWQEWRRRPNP
jgi:N-acetylglucosaminyldiphosphoundecaprenol N-acetyl-beta-D-mannosaminyltransferase